MAEGESGLKGSSGGTLTLPLLLAVLGGVTAACSCRSSVGVESYVELRLVVAGAICLAAGALAGNLHRAFAAGLVFAVTWGWAEAVFSPAMTFRDTMPLAVASGLLFGLVTMTGHLFCQHAWSHSSNGSATA